MKNGAGYTYLNIGNQWRGFDGRRVHVTNEGWLELDAAATRGVFRLGAFAVSGEPTRWFRLRVTGRLPAGTHLQLFTCTGDLDPAPWDPDGDLPFSDPGWLAAPRDALDLPVPGSPAVRIWIGGILRGSADASPGVSQIRLDYGEETIADFLPPLYRSTAGERDFMNRFVSPGQAVLDGIEAAIADLPRLFDPYAAPAGEPESWFAWLAGWLAFDLEERWSQEEARTYLAAAFELHGRRGTPEGLRRALKLYAGVDASIEEAILGVKAWSLGQTSVLGVDTMLASGPLQGAVLGTTATLDRSHLTADDFGANLFEDVAHRFCVNIPAAQAGLPGALAAVRAVIEREKPAHTVYEICVTPPMLDPGDGWAQPGAGENGIDGRLEDGGH